MTTNKLTEITTTHNAQLNEIKKRIIDLVCPGVVVNGEFIANTNESKDYLAFIYLTNIKGLAGNKVYSCGFELEMIGELEICVKEVKEYIDRQSLAYIWK